MRPPGGHDGARRRPSRRGEAPDQRDGDARQVTAEPSTRRTAPLPAVAGVVGVMMVVAAAGRFGPPRTLLVAGPLGAVGLLLLARFAGLSADDVGLGRRSLRRGAAYAAVCVAAVAAVYAVAARLSATRT